MKDQNIWDRREDERRGYLKGAGEIDNAITQLDEMVEKNWVGPKTHLRLLANLIKEINNLIALGQKISNDRRPYPDLWEEIEEISNTQDRLRDTAKWMKLTFRKTKAMNLILELTNSEGDLDVLDPTHAPRMWRAKLMLPRKPGRCGYKSPHYFIPGKHKHTRVERSFVEESRYGKKGQRYSAARKEREDERLTLINQMV